MLSGQRLADAIRLVRRLMQLASSHGLGADWVLASAAISAHESSGFDRSAHYTPDPNGGSKGFWQINGIHGVPDSVSSDPEASTDWWFSNMRPAAQWTSCGGSAAFAADPVRFMQCYAPRTQVSKEWTPGMATAALALARFAVDAAGGALSLPRAGTGGRAAMTEPEPTPPQIVKGPGGAPIKVCPPGRTLGADGLCHDTGWSPSLPSIPDIPNPADKVSELFDGLARLVGALFDRDIWVRVALFGGGVALALLGVWLAFSGTDTYKQAQSAAVAALSKGAVRGKGEGASS